MKETHPYLEKYKLADGLRYLIIGTFPPRKNLPPECRRGANRNFKIDYFYGNAGSFWRILEKIYPRYSFNSVESVRQWQSDFLVGITDTVKQCLRRNPCSFKDTDLVIDWSDYNHTLKDYIIRNFSTIEKLIFTSGENTNNALANFKILMGDSFELVKSKIISDLPSPSGGSNTSNFSKSDLTLGLKQDFYEFVLNVHPSELPYITTQWHRKKETKKKTTRIRSGLLLEYKVWKYGLILPKEHEAVTR